MVLPYQGVAVWAERVGIPKEAVMDFCLRILFQVRGMEADMDIS
jgi:hypothetical protein